MEPERWQKVKALLQSALELAADKREAFLDKTCAEDDELRREVESYLKAHDQADNFIEQPAFEIAAPLLTTTQMDVTAKTMGLPVEKDLIFRAGHQIGLYTLVRKLGKGSFGEVWLAEKCTELVTKKVAIKLLFEEQINLEVIRREAVLWEQASGHPNILSIIDADIYDGQVVIVSEYADGGSLHDWLKRHDGKSPSIEKAIDLMLGILNGLVHLHSHKIAHRDLKPQNILLHGEIPRIADFGISRIAEGSFYSTSVLGTPLYMSPEAFRKRTSLKTDIWSAGIIFYEMLTGSYPFYDEDIFVLIDAIKSDEPKALPENVPPELRQIVEKALQKNFDKRFQTVQEMRESVLDFSQRLAEQKRLGKKQEFPLTEPQKQESSEAKSFSLQHTKRNDLATVGVGEPEISFETLVKNQDKTPKRKTVLPIMIVSTVLIFITGFVAITFRLVPGVNKSRENPPSQVGNISETNILETKPMPTAQPPSSSNVLANTEPKSIEKTGKSSSTPQVKSSTAPQIRAQSTPRIEKTRPKPVPKKNISLEALIEDGKSRQPNN